MLDSIAIKLLSQNALLHVSRLGDNLQTDHTMRSTDLTPGEHLCLEVCETLSKTTRRTGEVSRVTRWDTCLNNIRPVSRPTGEMRGETDIQARALRASSRMMRS